MNRVGGWLWAGRRGGRLRAEPQRVRSEPGLQERIATSRGAIDFRNVIAREYDALSPATVWDIAQNELPALAAEAAAELARRDKEG